MLAAEWQQQGAGAAPFDRPRAVGCGTMDAMTGDGAPSRRAHGMLSRDSSPEVERLQIDLWRRMSPLDKGRAVDGLSRATDELALAGIRQRHPHAPEHECRLRLAVLKLGPQLAARVYPEAAALFDS